MTSPHESTPWRDYAPVQAWDEAMDVEGNVREPYQKVYSEIAGMSDADLHSRAEALASTYLAQGVTFDHAGEERPFPLDIVPRVIGSDEWDIISPGVAQRVRCLEAFLDDVYGSQRCVSDGIVPRRLITSSQHFHRSAAMIEPPGGVRVHIAGIDLVRDQHGIWRVLEDNVRVPSGVSYVLSNRRAMSQMYSELFATMGIRPVLEYSERLRAALTKCAPENASDEPTIVVLTPGVYNSAYYEHSLLARTMGVELVEGRDLEVVGGRVFVRTTAGRQRVDVIYRRVDDDYLDPVKFRPDSALGSPGLMTAARLGNVTIANAVGNGVADDKLIYTYIPDLMQYYLGENPILPNVDTWRLEEDEARAEVFDRLDELVVKPVDGAGGKGVVIGPAASREELDTVRTTIAEDPRGWIAQPVVQLSTVPTLTEDGLDPRHVDLRPFAINDGQDQWVLPGGLTRVALGKGQLIVNSSQGGGSKDTWVLGAPPASPEDRAAELQLEYGSVAPVPQSAHPEDQVHGQQQAQQQQGRIAPEEPC